MLSHSHSLSLLCVGLLATGWAATAVAQTPAAPATATATATATTMDSNLRAGTTPSEQARPAGPQLPVIHPFGVPLQTTLSAPVQPPYRNTAYDDLGGQPETSADGLMAQSERVP